MKNLIFTIQTLIAMIINGYFFNYINFLFFNFDGSKQLENIPKGEEFFVVVIFAPILETIFLQYSLYKLLLLSRVKHYSFYLITMAFIFSLLHTYNWLYVLMTFFGGLLLNNYYLKMIDFNNQFKAIVYTIVLHAIFNAYGFLFI